MLVSHVTETKINEYASPPPMSATAITFLRLRLGLAL
jgi:hypothetical protein